MTNHQEQEPSLLLLHSEIFKAIEEWEAAYAEDDARVWHYAADGTSATMAAKFRF
jgi:hypothetical protein